MQKKKEEGWSSGEGERGGATGRDIDRTEGGPKSEAWPRACGSLAYIPISQTSVLRHYKYSTVVKARL